MTVTACWMVTAGQCGWDGMGKTTTHSLRLSISCPLVPLPTAHCPLPGVQCPVYCTQLTAESTPPPPPPLYTRAVWSGDQLRAVVRGSNYFEAVVQCVLFQINIWRVMTEGAENWSNRRRHTGAAMVSDYVWILRSVDVHIDHGQ
jgi:hypothetical protein